MSGLSSALHNSSPGHSDLRQSKQLLDIRKIGLTHLQTDPKVFGTVAQGEASLLPPVQCRVWHPISASPSVIFHLLHHLALHPPRLSGASRVPSS